MPTYLRPGVYIEEIPSGSKPIEAVGTSTAAFVGYATQGTIDTPTLIFKWDDYVRLYGGIRDTGTSLQGDALGHSVAAFFQNGGSAAYIVRLAVGGQKSQGFVLHPDTADPNNPGPTDRLVGFTAVNEGTWGDALRVHFGPGTAAGTFNVRVGTGDGDDFREIESFRGVSVISGEPTFLGSRINGVSGLITTQIQDVSPQFLGTSTSGDLTGLDIEQLNGRTMTVRVDNADPNRTVTFAADAFDGDSTLGDVADAIETQVRAGAGTPALQNFTADVQSGNRLVLTSGSRTATSSVAVTGPAGPTNAAALLELSAINGGTERNGRQSLEAVLTRPIGGDPVRRVKLGGGNNGSLPARADYQKAFSRLEKVRDVSILCVPGQAYDSAGKPVVDDAISHAQFMKNRMVIVDPPPGAELRTEGEVDALGLPTSTYSVLYYPWTRVANPYFNAEKNPGVPTAVLAPPSGFAAGMWARIDGRRGVWKAPAGVETRLLGLAGLEYQVEDGEQDQLNPQGVNCLRTLPGFGQVIWGTRTLSTKADPEWRYVPVRRTAIFIEQSLYNGIQWAVFEPNDHRLWSSLRANIDSFMNGLFRSGAFQGEKASDAYFVRCGLGDTMTQGDIDRGQVIVIVGFAPLKPAEFVIVRIQQKVGQQ